MKLKREYQTLERMLLSHRANAKPLLGVKGLSEMYGMVRKSAVREQKIRG